MNLAIDSAERSAFRFPGRIARFGSTVLLGLAFHTTRLFSQANPANDPALFGVFVGSSSGGEFISQLLNIAPDPEQPIQWHLTLHHDPK